MKPVQAVRKKYHKGHVQRLRLFVLVTAIRFLEFKTGKRKKLPVVSDHTRLELQYQKAVSLFCKWYNPCIS